MILNNATLVTFWASKPFLEGALIALEGRTIVDFGTAGKLIDRYDAPQTLDVGGRIVMPRLVNAHTHLRRTLAQGMPIKGEPPRSFEDIQESLWWKFDRVLSKEDVYLAAKVGLLDSVRAGVTTVIDHHSSPATIPGSLDVVEQAFAEVGVRGSLAYATTDRYGERASRASIEENRRFLERRKSEGSEMMTGLFGLESSSSVSEKTLDRAVGVANEFDGNFHVHVSEDVVDLEKSRLEYGATPVQRLTAKGVLRGELGRALCSSRWGRLSPSQAEQGAGGAQPSVERGRRSGCGGRVALPQCGNSHGAGHRWLHGRCTGGVSRRGAFAACLGTSCFGSEEGSISSGFRGK